MLKHKGTQRIETNRLLLRRFVIDDAQAMFDNWASDEAVTKFLTWPVHSSPEVSAMVLKDWTESYSREDYYQWAIVLKEQGDEPIGSISGVRCNDALGIVHIGYCIGARWWHQGIMSEALQALIGFFFDEVGAQRIEAVHDPNNPHSGGVMRKCGMQYEGTLRRSERSNQGVCDACWYAILADERK